MGVIKQNMSDLEKEMALIENDAVSEEQYNADRNYATLDIEVKRIEDRIPYPDITPYSTGDYDEISNIKYMQRANEPHWDKLKLIKPYSKNGSLYCGHLYDGSKNMYFMDNPALKTKILDVDGKEVWFINTDDKNYNSYRKMWRYPSENLAVKLSRNITMSKRRVTDVEIVLDKGSEVFSNISDSYLKKALIRNKDKTGVLSIIQTIQKKQDDIRSLSKEKSFIVQGCAGSGKTMVLLHRLRYLLHNEDIQADEYMFLVPGKGFKGFIDEVSTNFNIAEQNILPYQEYYQKLVDKTPKNNNLSDVGESVFPLEYLERIYSKKFIQSAYNTLFDALSNQINSLIGFYENKFNELIEFEKLLLEDDIYSLKSEILKKVKVIVAGVQPHVSIKIKDDYNSINLFIEELENTYLERKSQYDVSNSLTYTITISPEDERLLTNKDLVSLKESISVEEKAIEKASVFTVLSHKNKLKSIKEKYDLTYSEIVKELIEQDKMKLKEQASQLVYVYDNFTITDVEDILNLLKEEINNANEQITSKQNLLDNVEEYLGEKFAVEIEKLNNLINASSEILNENNYVKDLIPSYTFFENTIKIGIELTDSFKSHINSKEKEYLKNELILFNERTENQLYAYLNTMLFNACKKAISKEFDIKICDAYKHYWYLDLYCSYLTKPLKTKSHKFLFIDEAQDLSLSEIELLYKVNANKDYPVMNLFGDTNQVITQHGVNNWEEVSIVPELYTLDENFRNTNQIVDYCNKYLSMNMLKIGVDMSEVSEYPSIKEALANSETIKTSPVYIVKDEYSALDLENLLKTYNVTEGYEIYTVKAVKGLEFKEVFVFDTDMTKNERYISYTRALAKLNVIKDLPKTADRTKSFIMQETENEKTIETQEEINDEN